MLTDSQLIKVCRDGSAHEIYRLLNGDMLDIFYERVKSADISDVLWSIGLEFNREQTRLLSVYCAKRLLEVDCK